MASEPVVTSGVSANPISVSTASARFCRSASVTVCPCVGSAHKVNATAQIACRPSIRARLSVMRISEKRRAVAPRIIASYLFAGAVHRAAQPRVHRDAGLHCGEEVNEMEQAQALAVVRSLANGVDPETGEVFPVESAYQRPLVVRARYEGGAARGRMGRLERGKAQLPAKTGERWTEEEDRKLLASLDAGRA